MKVKKQDLNIGDTFINTSGNLSKIVNTYHNNSKCDVEIGTRIYNYNCRQIVEYINNKKYKNYTSNNINIGDIVTFDDENITVSDDFEAKVINISYNNKMVGIQVLKGYYYFNGTKSKRTVYNKSGLINKNRFKLLKTKKDEKNETIRTTKERQRSTGKGNVIISTRTRQTTIGSRCIGNSTRSRYTEKRIVKAKISRNIVSI